jgi:hypothetical protein
MFSMCWQSQRNTLDLYVVTKYVEGDCLGIT